MARASGEEGQKSDKVRIILIRHGQTIHNERKAFAGRTDSPLTPLGRRQAGRLGNFFRNTKFTRIYASPMRRALDTALEIERKSATGSTVEIDPSLVEKSSGRLEGKSHRQVPGSVWKRMRRHPSDIFDRIEGGESMEDVRRRVAPLAKKLASERGGGTYGIVAHGGTVRALFSEITGFPLTHATPLKFDNCSVTDIVIDRKLSRIFAAAINSTSHLMDDSPEKREKRRFETKLILIRHGKTAFNKSLLMQGKSDTPLSDEGREQAKDLGRFLSRERIDAIYSSPLKRAYDTALEIARKQKRGARISVSPLLTERDFGRFEGKPLQSWISWRERSGRSDYIDKSHGGESQKDVEKRVDKFLKGEILGKNRGRTVAIVSHGNTLRVFISRILGVHPEKTRPFFTGNTKFTEIILSEDRGSPPRLQYFNEGAHLSGKGPERLDS